MSHLLVWEVVVDVRVNRLVVAVAFVGRRMGWVCGREVVEDLG